MCAALDPVCKHRLDLCGRDGHGGQDPRARRRPLNIGDGKPFAARKRMGGIEAESASAAADPLFAAGIAALGDTVGKGQRDTQGQAAPAL